MVLRYTPEERARIAAESHRKDIQSANGMLGMLQEHDDGDVRLMELQTMGADALMLRCDDKPSPTLAVRERRPASDKGNKWFRRPVTPDDASRCVRLARDFAEAVMATSDDDPQNHDTGVPLPHCTFRIAYEGEDPIVYEFSGHCTEIHALRKGILGIFSSVDPPSDFEDEAMSHMSRFEYGAGGFLGSSHTSVWATRDADGCHLSYEIHIDEGISSDRSDAKRSMPLTDDEWDSLVQALVQADLGDWRAGYAQLTVSDGIWQSIGIEFDDGWGMAIRGRNEWDSRFLPIAKELMRHGLDEADLFTSISEPPAMAPQGEAAEQDMDVAARIAEMRRILEENPVYVNPDGTICEGTSIYVDSDGTFHTGDDDGFVPIKKPIAGP